MKSTASPSDAAGTRTTACSRSSIRRGGPSACKGNVQATRKASLTARADRLPAIAAPERLKPTWDTVVWPDAESERRTASRRARS